MGGVKVIHHYFETKRLRYLGVMPKHRILCCGGAGTGGCLDLYNTVSREPNLKAFELIRGPAILALISAERATLRLNLRPNAKVD